MVEHYNLTKQQPGYPTISDLHDCGSTGENVMCMIHLRGLIVSSVPKQFRRPARCALRHSIGHVTLA